MGYDLTNVFVFFVFSALFVIATVSVVSRLMRPKAAPPAEPSKGETYECGEPAIGSSWVRFDIRFYTVALIFIIFDVEVAFLYPWGVVFDGLQSAGLGLFVFLEALIFLAILAAGLVYCWKKGDLDWVKSSAGSAGPAGGPIGPAAEASRGAGQGVAASAAEGVDAPAALAAGERRENLERALEPARQEPVRAEARESHAGERRETTGHAIRRDRDDPPDRPRGLHAGER